MQGEFLQKKKVNATSATTTALSQAVQLQDNRPKTPYQQKQIEQNIVQRKSNNTGLPDNLKSGIENLSGHSMDDVKVNYNSSQPAQLNAHAYAQGNQIHIAPGQEKHLPHEAWHVVQQKQGRVKPTKQLKGKTNINDDAGLEKEADVMGAKAQLPVSSTSTSTFQQKIKTTGFRQVPAISFKTAPVVQGKFFDTTKRKYLTPEEVIALVNGHVEYPEGDLLRAIEKLAEGPYIPFVSAEELIQIIRKQLTENTGQLEAGKETDNAQWRKINRIAGLIEAKLIGLGQVPKAAVPLVADLEKAFLLMREVLDINKVHLELVLYSLDHAVNTLQKMRVYLLKEPSGFMWRLYNIVSEFGPFAHALQSVFTLDEDDAYAEGTPVDKYKNEILAELRLIRQLMARSPHGVTVVAHRGHGPTNRTMGGLIQEDDQRRKNRPAENSPEAFNAAFRSVPVAPSQDRSMDRKGESGAAASSSVEKGPPPALDGVECDVYLSADNVAILSHEGNVKEQLNNAMKALSVLHNHTEVHDLSAAQIGAVKRTASGSSKFMTLAELLDMAAPVAEGYYALTGKAFRIEVEMKGAAKVKATADHLRASVAKTISKFHKTYPSLPVEIILFNGEADQVQSYSELRSQKTALGGMYTGINFQGGGINPMHVDELRAMIGSMKGIPDHLKDFIVTLVFGQELVPHVLQDVLGNLGPDQPLLYGKKKQRHPLSTKEIEAELAGLETWYALIEPGKNAELIQKLHVLTDYPVKAFWFKSAKMIADQIVILKKILATAPKDDDKKSEGPDDEDKTVKEPEAAPARGRGGFRGGRGGDRGAQRGGQRGGFRGGGRGGENRSAQRGGNRGGDRGRGRGSDRGRGSNRGKF